MVTPSFSSTPSPSQPSRLSPVDQRATRLVREAISLHTQASTDTDFESLIALYENIISLYERSTNPYTPKGEIPESDVSVFHQGTSPITRVAFLPNDLGVAFQDMRGTVNLKEVTLGYSRQFFGDCPLGAMDIGRVSSQVAFTTDGGRQIKIVQPHASLRSLDVHPSIPVPTVAGFPLVADSLCWSVDEQSIFVGTDSALLELPLARPEDYRVLLNHRDSHSSLTLSPDGRYLATRLGVSEVRIIDLLDGATLQGAPKRETSYRGTEPIWGVAFSPLGDTLALCQETTITLFRGDPTFSTLTFVGQVVLGNSTASAAFSPNGDELVAATGDKVIFFSTKPTPEGTLPELAEYQAKAPISSVAFHPEGVSVLAGDEDGTVLIFKNSEV